MLNDPRQTLMRLALLFVALWMGMVFAGCPPLQETQTAAEKTPEPAHPLKQVTVVYSGNTLGELKPCGCAKEEDQGGIERRMGYLNKVLPSNRNLVLVDLGDNFKEYSRQGRIKARYLMTAMARMGYDAVTIGEHDLVYGNRFLSERKNIPWVTTNMNLLGMSAPPYRIKTFDDGLTVAILAVSDPNLFYVAEHGRLQMEDPAEAVKKLLPEIRSRENPDLVVLLTHMTRSKGLKLMDLEGVDVVINGHIEKQSDRIDMEPVVKGNKIFVQPGPLGQKMGELKVVMDGGDKKIFQNRMVRLDSKVPDDPAMTELYEKYNKEVEDLFFASLKKKRSEDRKQVYATEKTCKTCHAEAHEVWAGSRHAHAYATLKEVNKSFDPECLQCHTTGFEKPGGFISEVDTPDLKNVQCEMCHGPRLDHTRAPKGGFAEKAREACSQCHVPKHSPNFDYSTYWPKIRH